MSRVNGANGKPGSAYCSGLNSAKSLGLHCVIVEAVERAQPQTVVVVERAAVALDGLTYRLHDGPAGIGGGGATEIERGASNDRAEFCREALRKVDARLVRRGLHER